MDEAAVAIELSIGEKLVDATPRFDDESGRALALLRSTHGGHLFGGHLQAEDGFAKRTAGAAVHASPGAPVAALVALFDEREPARGDRVRALLIPFFDGDEAFVCEGLEREVDRARARLPKRRRGSLIAAPGRIEARRRAWTTFRSGETRFDFRAKSSEL